MIRFVKNGEIDREKWNQCIAQSGYPTVFADYDFLKIASPYWCALIKGNYEYVMPLPVRSRLSIRYVYMPFFVSRLGIFSAKPVDAKLIEEFVARIPSSLRQIDLFLNPANPVEETALHPVMMNSYRLKLNRPYVLLQQLFTENTRRNIKSSQKHKLTTCYDVQVRDVVRLFKAGRGRDKAVGYTKRDYARLGRMAAYMEKKGKLDITGARDEKGNLLAGALFLRDYDRIWFWFSGRNKAFSEKKAMFFIINEYLKEHANEAHYFDFNGSMNENIARFYRGFGAEKYQFPMLNIRRYSYLSPFIRIYKAIIK